MMRSIPTSLGLLTLSAFASGCSDAHKLASALEKICEAQCECPDAMEEWNDVSNCKESCRGYSIMVEARLEDEVETEPCSNFDNILDDLKRCAKNSCGQSRYECLSQAYYELYECWDIFGGYNYSPMIGEVSTSELVQQLLEPIPGALDPDTLHSASSN
jgi:hypothetical protein